MHRFALLLAVLAAPAFGQGVLFERGVNGVSPHLRAVSERVHFFDGDGKRMAQAL